MFLFFEGEAGCHQVPATNAKCFVVAPGFLVYTTTAHAAHFAPLAALSDLLSNSDGSFGVNSTVGDSQGRARVKVATAVPTTMSLILQMPRGNLETTNLRPLVTEIAKQDIDTVDYAKAFASCRGHHIDLTVFKCGVYQSFLDQNWVRMFRSSPRELTCTSHSQGTLTDVIVNHGPRREKKDMI